MACSVEPTPTNSYSDPPTSNNNSKPTNTTNKLVKKSLTAMEAATPENAPRIADEPPRFSAQPTLLRLTHHGDGDVTWVASGSGSATLFVRPCYKVLFVLATEFMACTQKTNHVILTGSHGIGKRSFLNYMLFRLRQRSCPPTIILDLPGFFGLIDPDGHLEVGCRETSFHAELADRATFYLCDATGTGRSPLCEERVQAKSVVVTPPITTRIAAFERHHQCLTFVMPLWSPGELASCREACFPHISPAELAQRYEMWGGIIKWTLATSLDVASSQFARSVSLLSLDQAAALATERGFVATEQELTEGHYLVEIDIERNDTFQLRRAFLCSLLACSQLVDAEQGKEQVVAFITEHRASYRLKTLTEQVEDQLMRWLFIA